MCAETMLSTKDFIAPVAGLLGTIFVSSMAYFGIFIKLKKDSQTKWVDEFRREVVTFIAYARRINDLVRNERFDKDKRDTLLHDLTICTTQIQFHIDLKKESHELLRKEIQNVFNISSEGKANKDLSDAIDILGTLAKGIIAEEMEEINNVFPNFK